MVGIDGTVFGIIVLKNIGRGVSLFDYIFSHDKEALLGDLTPEIMSREIFRSSPEGILLLSKRGLILDANEKICGWIGLSKSRIINKSIFSIPSLSRRSKEIIKKNFKMRLKGNEILPYEIELYTPEKEKFFGRIHASLLYNQEKDIIGEIVMISDINDAKKAAEEERLVYRDMQLLSEAALGFVELDKGQDIYFFIGKKLRELVGDCYIIVNKYLKEQKATQTVHFVGPNPKQKKALQLMKSWPVGEVYPLSDDAKKGLLGRSLKKMQYGVNEISQGKIPRYTSKIIETVFGIGDIYTVGFAWKGEIFGNAAIITKKGHKVRKESILTYLHQASVALQRKEAADALQKAHDELEIRVEERTKDLRLSNQDLEKFKLAVKDASDHIIITDIRGKIVFANAAAEKITGYTYEQMKGKTPALWGRQMSAEFYQKFWQTIQSKKSFMGEIRNKRNGDVEYWAEIHVSPVLDENNNILFFVGIERDITKAKEVDQAKTEFVSLASHQLRTPLSAINWYTEMLMAGDAGIITKDQEQYLKEIYSGSQRMVDLVNALLNVSRLELGTFIVEPTEGSLQEIADDVLKELENQVTSKQLQVSKDYDSKIPKLLIDIKLTRIVFQNLLSNAVKYTPDQGTIFVSIIINPSNGEEVLIKVADTGYGIPKYQQDRIFSKLFRADNVKKMETEGTGLGVYIIKQIIDNAGGKIWFKSEENKGTTFFVTIPLGGMKKKEGSRELS